MSDAHAHLAQFLHEGGALEVGRAGDEHVLDRIVRLADITILSVPCWDLKGW